ALPLPGLRAELHRHPAPRHAAAAAQGGSGAPVRERGLSMNRTAKLLGVSTPTGQAWIERFAQAHARKPEPEGRAVVAEPDEMGPSLKKSRTSSGCGRRGIVLRGGSSAGSWAVVTGPPSSASSN